MHQTRKSATIRLPIKRKGTKYVARALNNLRNSVPVSIAVRDMLKLARTAKEVKEMIKNKMLKINGRAVRDVRDSIQLFNLFEADKTYRLVLLKTGKFSLEISKEKSERLCKIMNKRLLKSGEIQINLHDGTNIISKDNLNVGDSVYLDFSGKISNHVPLEKGKTASIISGSYIGQEGKIKSIDGKNILVSLDDKEVALHEKQIVAL